MDTQIILILKLCAVAVALVFISPSLIIEIEKRLERVFFRQNPASQQRKNKCNMKK